MKTFIWNTEYDVIVAMAETEIGARSIAIAQFITDKLNYINEEQKDKQTNLNRVSGVLRSDVPTFFEAIYRSPDSVIEPFKASIYQHANE